MEALQNFDIAPSEIKLLEAKENPLVLKNKTTKYCDICISKLFINN